MLLPCRNWPQVLDSLIAFEAQGLLPTLLASCSSERPGAGHAAGIHTPELLLPGALVVVKLNTAVAPALASFVCSPWLTPSLGRLDVGAKRVRALP